MSQKAIKVRLLLSNANHVDVDVLALKYAQANYGLDLNVSKTLISGGIEDSLLRPKPNEYSLVNGVPGIAARHILFVGVVPISSFRYSEIREFSSRVLSALSEITPRIERLALTLHGVGYGLDENEVLEAEIAGFIDALESQKFPNDLNEVIIVEGDPGRVNRLDAVLKQMLPTGCISTSAHNGKDVDNINSEKLSTVGYDSESKDHIFVAMPFKEDMDDVYHYGIQGATRRAGFLCERADISSFTGDVMDWVRERIRTAHLVIADLTEANPNVYLEVGYAWGCGVQTVLLVRDTNHLKFDTRGQRCISYKNISDLENSLTKELRALRSNGVV